MSFRASASSQLDRRLIPGETKESVVNEIRESLDAAGAGDSGLFATRLIVDPTGDFIAANITDEHSPFVQAIQESIRIVTGKEPEYFVAWAGRDRRALLPPGGHRHRRLRTGRRKRSRRK